MTYSAGYWEIPFKGSVASQEGTNSHGCSQLRLAGFQGATGQPRGLSGVSKATKSGKSLVADMQKAIERYEGAARKAFVRDVVAVASSDEIKAAIAALQRGSVQEAIQHVGRTSFDFDTLTDTLKKAATTAIEISNQSLVSGTQDSFTITNELAAKAALKAGKNIPNLSAIARKTVSAAIADNINEGLTLDETATRIQNAIGLDSRGQTSVDNYRRSLIKEGRKRTVVDRLTRSYTARLTNQRAMTIARTETVRAANAGQIEYWNDMAQQGYLTAAKTFKEWITASDERTCPLCGPMDGARVLLGELFDVGGMLIDGPVVHPNCRCSLALFIES